jgi:hypothetical protein
VGKIDIESLPDDIRAQIEELSRPKPPLFPIAPREFDPSFATKEVREMAEKVDLLIQAVNILHENLGNGK